MCDLWKAFGLAGLLGMLDDEEPEDPRRIEDEEGHEEELGLDDWDNPPD